MPNTSRAGGHPSPGAGLYPNLGWNIGDNISLSSDPVFETEVAERDEVPCLAVMVPPEDMPVYHYVSTLNFLYDFSGRNTCSSCKDLKNGAIFCITVKMFIILTIVRLHICTKIET